LAFAGAARGAGRWLAAVKRRALDAGCGLGVQAGYLAAAGWQVTGIDLSQAALARAAAGHDGAASMRADVRRLPFHRHCLHAAPDRGCFHYLGPAGPAAVRR
jgi:SAM-dependent methyltransferase